MKIVWGADHAGLAYKQYLIGIAHQLKHQTLDYGTLGEASVDYPDFAHKVCLAITEEEADRGVLICGSGIGMSIVANRYPAIRAALCFNAEMAKLARAHNDANILILGQRFVGRDIAEACFREFLTTPFEGGRHLQRLQKINRCG